MRESPTRDEPWSSPRPFTHHLSPTMLADLDLALKRPAELVQQLYAKDASLDGFEQRVADSFSALISADGALEQVRARILLQRRHAR